MRLAWLRADAPRATDPLDDTAALVDALRLHHDVQLFTHDTVGDFSAQHERTPFDLPVYELDNTPAHASWRPLLSCYGGGLMLRTLALPDLGAAVMASRVSVVSCLAVADDLRARYPERRVSVAAVGVRDVQGVKEVQGVRPSPVVFGTLSGGRNDLLRRAFDRAGLCDDSAALLADVPPEQVLREAHVIVSVPWPWSGEPATEALVAMAAGTPVVVIETTGTADWPALNPQSWQRRGPTGEAPIVVSVDPLDEEHSLALAIGRLSTDAALRAGLGRAAKEWWRTHATPAHAAADWEQILSEAAQAPAMGPQYL